MVSPSRLPVRDRAASLPTSFSVPPFPVLFNVGEGLTLLLASLEFEEAAPTVADVMDESTVVLAGVVATSVVLTVPLDITKELEEGADPTLRRDTDVELDVRPADVVVAALSSPPICVGFPYSTDPPPKIAGNA